jgi:tRNA threonylcarbamoyladenosine biosynthesis protein TsaB
MDTSGAEGSVAVARWSNEGKDPEERVLVLAKTFLGSEQEHAALLVPTIADILGGLGASADDLDCIVVGAGPGSFTGVRVGAATAKGMAWALGVPLYAFSSLAGAAVEAGDLSLRPRMVLFDARGDRLYAAAYRISHGSMDTLLPPRATTLGEILDEGIPPGAALMGSGAVRHRAILGGAGHPILDPPAGRPSASGLASLLTLESNVLPVEDVNRWEPSYLRDSGAERSEKTRKGPKGL